MERNPMNSLPNLAPLLEGFFTQRLIAQRHASPHTIASYRDTFRLLLGFLEKRSGRAPSQLALADINPPLVASFLDELESQRTNSARSRNLRLAAIRSFFRYAALEAPEHSAMIQRVLTIPRKRHTRPLIDFLVRAEIEALLAVPDRHTWLGQRDHAFLLVAVQTGLRLSELTGLRQQDVSIGVQANRLTT
jgi:integrase/recombinase XerD